MAFTDSSFIEIDLESQAVELEPKAKKRRDHEADDLEILLLGIYPRKSKRSLFICSIYRPPSDKLLSTETALIRVVDQLLLDLDKNK